LALGGLDHPPSHIHKYECGGLAFHCQATAIPVYPSQGRRFLTLDDIKDNIVDFDVHTAETKIIALENTLNGMVMPLDDIK
jgi:threonine aldolase